MPETLRRSQFAIHDAVVELSEDEECAGSGFAGLLGELNGRALGAGIQSDCIGRFTILRRDSPSAEPTDGRLMLNAEGVRAFDAGESIRLTDGASLLDIWPARREGVAALADGFHKKPEAWRRKFWTFGLLNVLRSLGFYSLHAAGLVSRDGRGVLVVAQSGGGKSTLSLGLLVRGWRCLSDDALLLCNRNPGIEALRLRAAFYVDLGDEYRFPGLAQAEVAPDGAGRLRRRMDVAGTFPGRIEESCYPDVILFVRVSGRERSALDPVDGRHALRLLLQASGSQLFDRTGMGPHLATLATLTRQARAYELAAGTDLLEEPLLIEEMLKFRG
jgi:hypothetical protein